MGRFLSNLTAHPDPEGVVIKTIALQEIGTPSVRPGRIGFQGKHVVWLNVAFYESP